MGAGGSQKRQSQIILRIWVDECWTWLQIPATPALYVMRKSLGLVDWQPSSTLPEGSCLKGVSQNYTGHQMHPQHTHVHGHHPHALHNKVVF